MLNLPTELVVYIVSFLSSADSARERVKLLYVSRKLRSIVSETPSLWREFVWPYYHTGDEGCVNNALKLCGQHVRLLSFPHHVTPSTLVGMSEYCKNVIQLCLPTTKLNPEHLANILQYMGRLQKLDIQWDPDHEMKRLLDKLAGMTLIELTIRVWGKLNSEKHFDYNLRQSASYFLERWILLGFVPAQNIHLFVTTTRLLEWEKLLKETWHKAKCDSPDGRIGYFKWYINHKVPVNLFPVLLPIVELELGRTTHLPFVHAKDCGVTSLNHALFMLANSYHNGKVVCQATVSFEVIYNKDFLSNDTNLDCVIQLNLSNCLPYNELGQIGDIFPNLQRLNASGIDCLQSLRGLRTISSSCRNLQGINLLGIPARVVEDKIQLWEILSDMKLTHLAIDSTLLLPSTEDEKQKMVSLFEKCTNLRALETEFRYHQDYKRTMKQTIFSHFSSLVWYRTYSISVDQTAVLQDLLTGCKELTCLSISSKWICVLPSFSLSSYCSLQQLLLNSNATHLPDNFMSTISAHGELVHVVLCVQSVTSDGVTVLVRNSPNLMTFHVIVKVCQDTLTHESIDPKVLEMMLKEEYYRHQLFVQGSCIVMVVKNLADTFYCCNVALDCQYNCDLFSMWS